MRETALLFGLMILTSTLSAQNTNDRVPLVVAHRGYWDTEQSAQNSLASLREAASAKCYASELDVWYTADNLLVVHHDATCNDARIEESRAEDITCNMLSNGEHVPTLEEYLSQAEMLDIRLVVEIKSHTDKAREAEAVGMIVEAVGRHNLAQCTDYISFSRLACEEFIRLTDAKVFYLNGDMSPAELKEAGFAGADYNKKVFYEHPEWIEQLHALGLEANIWTVNSREDMLWAINHGVDYITTNAPTSLQALIATMR